VFGGSWIAVRIGVGRLPNGTNWGHVLGLAVTCGIGFTVALFVADLSFTDPVLTASATIGVLAASALAGTFGFLLLRFLPRAAPSDVAPDSDG
jgi:NhaA family Na+:H+ antiporter